jgi:hypothetical protein
LSQLRRADVVARHASLLALYPLWQPRLPRAGRGWVAGDSAVGS